MTDGIIQEVFKKYSFCDEDIDTANKLMQELIAKIKQELNKPGCNSYCKMHRKRLIGDNQE